MKHKVGKSRKEPERGSKKRKAVGNDNSLASMYVCKSVAGMSVVENVPTAVYIKHRRDDLLHTSSRLGGRWVW